MPILLSLLSIVRRTPDAAVSVYIVTMDLTDIDARFDSFTEGERKIMEEVVKSGHAGNSITFLDGRESYLRLLHGKNTKNSYTPYAMGRLILPRFGLKGRVIYLDSDVMCCSSLTAFDEIDMEGYEFAAAIDVLGTFWIERDYCNSGVMLINLDRVAETGLFDRACKLVTQKRMMFPDQTALNKLAQNKLILPRRFNEQRAICDDTVLKHFCQGIRWLPFFKVYNYKQTEIEKVHKKLKITCFDDIYEEYSRIAVKYGLAQLK